MLVIRPVVKEDLSQLYELSALAQAGLTTFPHKRSILKQRVEDSLKLFKKPDKFKAGGSFLFVLEDQSVQRIVGICAITPQIGVGEPSYTYKIKTAHKESKTLNVKNKIQYLKLKREFNGPSEIGTLFLHPHYRKNGAGRLLSLSRFVFMAQYGQYFKPRVIAEMRGVVHNDRSPFWNAVCKHFFSVEFKKADLMVMEDKSFIRDLIPLHPIYIPILPESAQQVIGCVHPNTEPARAMLTKEGFKFINEIDIFEAGPVVGARVKNIRTVRKSRVKRVMGIRPDVESKRRYLMANVNALKQFRVVMASTKSKNSGVIISEDVAKALRVREGDQIRMVSAKG